jgi:hypothetical protein
MIMAGMIMAGVVVRRMVACMAVGGLGHA